MNNASKKSNIFLGYFWLNLKTYKGGVQGVLTNGIIRVKMSIY